MMVISALIITKRYFFTDFSTCLLVCLVNRHIMHWSLVMFIVRLNWLIEMRPHVSPDTSAGGDGSASYALLCWRHSYYPTMTRTVKVADWCSSLLSLLLLIQHQATIHAESHSRYLRDVGMHLGTEQVTGRCEHVFWSGWHKKVWWWRWSNKCVG